MVKSNFSAFSKKLKDADKALNKGRKGRKGYIEVEPGKYATRFQSLEFGVKGSNGYTLLTSIVVEAEDDEDVGSRIAEYISFEEKSGTKNGKNWKITEEDHFANLCTALIAFGIDTSELEMDDLEAVSETLAEDQPATSVTVTEKNGYMNVKWGKFIDDDELPSLEDVLEEDDDDDDDQESDDDDGDDTDTDTESDDDGPVEKGQSVKAKLPRGKSPVECTVKASNKSKQTCTLIRTKDKREFKDIDWSAVTEIIVDEE